MSQNPRNVLVSVLFAGAALRFLAYRLHQRSQIKRLSMNGTCLDIFDAIRSFQINPAGFVMARIGEEGIIIVHSLGRFWARIQGPEYVKVLYFPCANDLARWWLSTYE